MTKQTKLVRQRTEQALFLQPWSPNKANKYTNKVTGV